MTAAVCTEECKRRVMRYHARRSSAVGDLAWGILDPRD